MTLFRQHHRNLDVACALGDSDAKARNTEWQRLRAQHGLGGEVIAGGARLWLAAAGREAAEDLLAREALCCGFLDLELADDGDRLRLDISSPTVEAAEIIACLTGLDATCGLPCC